MNTPFDSPNLANYIKTQSNAELETLTLTKSPGLTFSDGSTLTTAPSTGFVGCSYSLNSTAGGAAAPWVFGTKIFDADDMYNTSSGEFTIPSAGKYMFYMVANGYANAGLQHINIQFQKKISGSFVNQTQSDKSITKDNLAAFSMCFSFLIDLAKDDVCQWRNNSGVNSYQVGGISQMGCYKVD